VVVNFILLPPGGLLRSIDLLGKKNSSSPPREEKTASGQEGESLPFSGSPLSYLGIMLDPFLCKVSSSRVRRCAPLRPP